MLGLTIGYYAVECLFIAVLLALRFLLMRCGPLLHFGRLSAAFFVVHCLPCGLLGLHRWLGFAAFLPFSLAVGLAFGLAVLLALAMRIYVRYWFDCVLGGGR